MSHEAASSEEPSLSSNAQLLMDSARNEAHRLNQREFGTEHFLLAAAKSGFFGNLGLDYNRISDQIIMQSSSVLERLPVENLQPSIQLNQIFDNAKNKCIEDTRTVIDEKDLFLSLLNQERCTALRLINALGIKPDDLRTKLLQ